MKVKTTLYLDRATKDAVERVARERRITEAEVMRQAIAKDVRAERPRPTGGFLDAEPFAENVDEILAQGFGRD
jgi:hypothetical protein